MGIEEDFKTVVERALGSLVASGELPTAVVGASFAVERPKRAEHGDVAVNAPLSLSKLAGKKPRDIATLLVSKLEAEPVVRSVEIAGPGFLNIKLAPSAFHSVLGEMVRAGNGYGRAAAGSGERILLEFVSANPTGPLLISHARGALVGDAVARILEAAGNHVSREYYINDFGNQVRLFAASVASVAYDEPPPEGGYGGAYVKELGKFLRATSPAIIDDFRADPQSEDALAALSRICVMRMLEGVPGSAELQGIRNTLASLRVSFDNWYSEESLHRWGRVQAALDRLQKTGFVQTLDDGALVFKMPEGQGEKDEEYEGEDKKKGSGGGRVVRKSDGKTYTYFASDIAYHADKVDRGYTRIINVLGADHHGYTARIRNVMQALGLPKDRFEVILFQLVSLLKDGKPFKIGKRLGNFITCDEVIEEIDEALGEGAGTDALRYFYLSRRTENPVDLDIDIAKKATIDNPVIYLQYGHARFCSLLRKAKDIGLAPAAYDAKLLEEKLVHPLELSSLQRLGTFPRVVKQAANDLSPTNIIQFLKDMAEDFNGYWTQTYQEKDPILPPDKLRAEPGWEQRWDFDKTRARLLWVDEMRKVYATGLALVGIRAPERIERAGAPSDDAGDQPQEAPAGALGKLMDRGVRNLEQIQESEGDGGMKLGGLVLASLGSACVVFAVIALLRRPTQAPTKAVDPLDDLLARTPAASARPRELSASDVTFPAMLSDAQRPTTALAAIQGHGPQAPADSAALPFELPPGSPTAPPPAGDRLPVVPMPAQRVISASPVVTDPRDPLTTLAKDRSTPTGKLAEPGTPGIFNLQVASFKTQPEAESFSTVLRQRGHHAYVESAEIPGRGTWYRVRVGPFKTMREANKYRAGFEAKEHIVPFVVETEKEKHQAEQREAEKRAREARRRHLRLRKRRSAY